MAGARHRTERHRSHRLIAGLGVIALLLALLGGVADAAPGTISGTVTDEGGEPLADVIVTAYGASGGYGGSVIDQTDAEGVFQLTVGAGDHQLFFSRSGYVSEYYDDVTTGGTVIPVTVPSGGAVSGLVVDLALAGQVSGNLVLPPAEGPYAYYEGNVCAHPVPEGPGSYPMCTGLDAVGDYLFDSLAPGSYRIEFRGYGSLPLQPSWYPGVSDPDDAEVVVVAAGATVTGIDGEVVPYAQVMGTVTGPTGAPVWASVSLYVDGEQVGGATTSSIDGTYSIYAVPSGVPFCLEIEPARPELAPWWSGGGMETCELAALTPGQMSTVDAAVDWFAPFPDVPVGHPFLGDVAWMVREGLASGFLDGTFKPGQPVTRGQLAKILHARAGSPAPSGPTLTFTDVDPSNAFATAIAWLASTGATGGFADGTFRPGDQVSRQAAAAFLWRLAGSPVVSGPSLTFTDVPPSHPFATAIAWLASTGATGGFPDGSFGVAAPVTRQSIAAFLHRLAGPDVPPGTCCYGPYPVPTTATTVVTAAT